VTAAIPSTLPVGFVERMVYLMTYFGMFRPQLGAVVVFDGRLDEARLRRSMVLLLEAEPVLGCRFLADAKPPVWRRLESIDAQALLRVANTTDLRSDAAAFIAEPFDPGTGPQILAALLRGPDSDALAVKVAHLVMDGGALKETLYMIGRIYRTLGAQPDWLPEPNLDGVRMPMADGGLLDKLRAMRSQDAAIPASDWPLPEPERDAPPVYLPATLEPDVFRAATALGRAAGATVNDIVLAAYYRAMYRVLDAAPGARTPMALSCELRKHLPPGTKTALSNISSAWNISVPPIEDEPFGGTLARVVAATSAWKAAGAGRNSALMIPVTNKLTRRQGMEFYRKLAAKQFSGEGGNGYPTLTNIGVIDDGLLDFGPGLAVTDAWLHGPLSSDILLTASTFRDRLHLSLGVAFAVPDKAQARAIVECTAAEITQWVAAG
jgi:NRPS condensation-like uncharacterized protein